MLIKILTTKMQLLKGKSVLLSKQKEEEESNQPWKK